MLGAAIRWVFSLGVLATLALTVSVVAEDIGLVNVALVIAVLGTFAVVSMVIAGAFNWQ